jgi:hypothetical protein
MSRGRGKYDTAMFVIPPDRKFDAPAQPPSTPQWEINPNIVLPKDFQRTAPRMKFASYQFLVPPGKDFAPRDEAPLLRAGATQWELPPAGTLLSPKDLGSARAHGLHSPLEFLVHTSPVQSSRRNVEVPAEHAKLRAAAAEAPRGLRSSSGGSGSEAGGALLPLPPLPAPGTARAAPPEPSSASAGAGAVPPTMAEIIMLRDGRGPALTSALPRALADAVAAARLVATGGAAMGEGERGARMAQVGAVLAGGAQRSAVAAAVGTVQAADAVLRAHRLRALDTRRYEAALCAAREGGLMAACGGTPAALRRTMTARREALGV